jgi:hypothetical protein
MLVPAHSAEPYASREWQPGGPCGAPSASHPKAKFQTIIFIDGDDAVGGELVHDPDDGAPRVGAGLAI